MSWKLSKLPLNPVDSRFKDITVGIAKQDFSESDKTIPSLDFFETYTAEDFAKYKAEQGLAMEVDDLLFIQRITSSQIWTCAKLRLNFKVLDTYWSDHCRHTTFSTELTQVKFDEGDYKTPIVDTYNRYLSDREVLYKGRDDKIRLPDGSCSYGYEETEIRRQASGSGRVR